MLDDYPRGPGSDLLTRLMSESVGAVRRSSGERRPARSGQAAGHQHLALGAGQRAAADAVRRAVRETGAMITAVDLLRGLATADRLAADRRARRDRLPRHRLRRQGPLRGRGLKDVDLVCVHVEATDEASHEGNAAAKIEALEEIDRHIVGPLWAALRTRTAIIASWSARPSDAAADQDAQPRRRAVRNGRPGIGPTPPSTTTIRPPPAPSLVFPEGWRLMGHFLGEK